MSGAATVGRLVVAVSGDVDQLKIDMREAQAITNAATKDIVNGLQGISEATSTRNAAGKRMLAALQEEINTFGMSSEQMTLYKAGLLGVGDQATALVERLGQMRAAQAGFNDQLAASEAAATARIREMVAASLDEVKAVQQSASATQTLAAAQTALSGVARTSAESQRLNALNMAGVAAAMRGASDQSVVLSANTQRILDKYDPLGTKLRSLQSDMATLRKEMGNSVDPAAMKAFEGLEAEITQTKVLMHQAGVEGFGALEDGAKKSAFATAGATRELLVLGHEVISGNFSRIPGSLMVLAERMGGLSEILTPATIGMVALGVAGLGVAGAMIKGHEQLVALNNALLVTSDYAGVSRQSMERLANSMTQTHEVTIGTANAIVLALTASGRIGGEAIGQIAHFISDFAKSTGQDIDQIAPKLIALFEDPLRGAQELNSSMHFLTTTQLEHIAALERTGQVQAAQAELAKAASDHMPKQAENLGYVTKALLDQRDAWTKVGQAMLNLGKAEDTSANAQAQKVRDEISELLAKGYTRQSPEIKYWQNVLDAMEPALNKQRQLTEAEKAAAAANELQAKSWDAVKASSTAYHVQELQDRLKLIEAHKSEAGPDFAAQEAAKRDAIRKTKDEIDAANRSMVAEDRQLSEQQLASIEALAQVRLKAAADDYTTRYKLGTLSKDDFDQDMLMNALEENQAKQNYERAMLRVAGLSAAERQAHQQKLALLQAEADAIEQKGVNAQSVDDKKAYDDIVKAAHDAGVANIASLDQQIIKQREHNAEIGKSKEQIELARQAAVDLQTTQLQADADYLRDGLAKWQLDDRSRAVYELRLNDLDEEIKRRQILAGLLADGAVREADAKAAEEATRAWKRSANTIENDLASAIVDGGGRGWQRLAHDMEVAFAKLVLRPILQPISNGISSYLYPTAAQAQAAGTPSGGTEQASGEIGLAVAASNAYKAISGGFSGLSSAVATGYDSLAGMFGPGTIGATGTSATGAMLGSAAGYGAGLLGGHYIGNAIAGDYSVGDHGQAVTNISSIVGAVIGGPIGAAIGGAIGGLINRAFGMGSKDVSAQGMRGTLSDAGLTGENYSTWHQNGGWFRSDQSGTDTTAFSGDVSKQFTEGFAALEAASIGFAKSVGASTDALAGYSKAFDITLGSDAAANQKAITDFFAGLGDEMAKKLVPNLDDFTKSGETASAALERLAGDFKGTDQVAQLLGTSAKALFGSAGLDSAKAREGLIDAAGGLAALNQEAATFGQNFLSDAERLAPVQKALSAALASLGYASLQTRDDFKNAVNGLITSGAAATEAGAKSLTSLLALADVYNTVHPDTSAADSEKANTVLQEHQNLQDQYDQMTMTSTQLLAKQRDALDASNRPLFDQIQLLKEHAAAEQLQKDAIQATRDQATSLLGSVDTAFSVLQSVVGREKGLLQTRIDTETAAVNQLKSLSAALHQTLDGMHVPDQSAFDRAAAQAQIKTALAIAKAGGPLPAADSLQKALSTVSQDASSQFASYADYLRDYYSTKNDIADLASVSDDQLTVEQKTLEALQDQMKGLDKILASAQDQIDVLKGQSSTLLSIDDAVRGLSLAIMSAKANPVVAAGQAVGQAYQSALGRAPDAAGLAYWQQQAAAGTPVDAIVGAINNSPEATIRGMYETMFRREPDAAGLNYWLGQLGKGVSLSAIGNALAGSDEAQHRLPGFAAGGDFAGGFAMVGETGPEVIATGPARVFNASQTSGILSRLASPSDNSTALLQEVKGQRAEIALLRKDTNAALLAIAKHSMKTANAVDDAVTGTRPLITKAGT